MIDSPDRTSSYQADSLSFVGAVALGSGVMIGAGIFALTGQMAEMTGGRFPLAFLSAALIVSFSAYAAALGGGREYQPHHDGVAVPLEVAHILWQR
jgi:amino acid transporter